MRLIAPLLGGISLAVACYLAIDYIDLLTAAGTVTNLILLLPIPVVFVVGVLVALRLRRTDPAAYARLTTTEVEETV